MNEICSSVISDECGFSSWCGQIEGQPLRCLRKLSLMNGTRLLSGQNDLCASGNLETFKNIDGSSYKACSEGYKLFSNPSSPVKLGDKCKV